jgi:hypothetical protein
MSNLAGPHKKVIGGTGICTNSDLAMQQFSCELKARSGICLECGKPINIKRLTCGEDCSHKRKLRQMRKANAKHRLSLPVNRTCPECRKPIKDPKRKTCSTKCARRRLVKQLEWHKEQSRERHGKGRPRCACCGAIVKMPRPLSSD